MRVRDRDDRRAQGVATSLLQSAAALGRGGGSGGSGGGGGGGAADEPLLSVGSSPWGAAAELASPGGGVPVSFVMVSTLSLNLNPPVLSSESSNSEIIISEPLGPGS
jgi:hypothetical protein